MKVVWSRAAIRNLTAVRAYIAKDSDAGAARVAALILRSVALLEAQPEMGRPGRLVGTRELVVPGTAYVVPYRVRRGALELIAVLHGNQKWPR